jgi:alkylation response protein AidB-like acyl-CoA dehydrogenase
MENGQPRLRDGKPETRYCFVPVAQAEMLDTWHVRGMRGTGTHHFAVNDVFVPEHRTVFTRGATVLIDNPLYRVPFTLHFATGDSAAALATARSFLAEFYELAGSKAPRYSTGLLRDQSITQYTVGQVEALIRSARSFILEAVEEMWAEALQGPVSWESRARLRLATTHGIRTAAQAIEMLYPLCGANVVFEGSRMHRHFQDIHVITQHVQSRVSHYELVGQFWLGAPYDETRF